MTDKRRLALGSLAVLLFLLSAATPVVRAYNHVGNDDLFGYHFDPNFITSSVSGTKSYFSISTTGVSVDCTDYPYTFPAEVQTVAVSSSPSDYILQGAIYDGCNGSTGQWSVDWAYFDNNGHFTEGTMWTGSLTTYPSLTGYESIFWNVNYWDLDIHLDQTGVTYPHNFGTIGGQTTVDPSNNQWTAVETYRAQPGISTGFSFNWQLTNPYFKAGSWVNYNNGGGGWTKLDLYITYAPIKQTNLIGVQHLSTPGVKVIQGTSEADGTVDYWCISGNCPPGP
jgi:hypothetical protein